jgi:adenylate cyclase
MKTIMMTDIVGFTELTRQKKELIGELSRKHGRIIREAVSAQGGKLINIFGDGALALFDLPGSAIDCAIEIQRESHLEPAIPMRIACTMERSSWRARKCTGKPSTSLPES